jgi:hypothetical protein
MEVFPSDLASLPPAGVEFLRTGQLPGYDDWAHSALADADTAEE